MKPQLTPEQKEKKKKAQTKAFSDGKALATEIFLRRVSATFLEVRAGRLQMTREQYLAAVNTDATNAVEDAKVFLDTWKRRKGIFKIEENE